MTGERRPGMNRDSGVGMTRLCTIVLVSWLWASTACAQTEPASAARAVDARIGQGRRERPAMEIVGAEDSGDLGGDLRHVAIDLAARTRLFVDSET